jgi:hypothetical protein
MRDCHSSGHLVVSSCSQLLPPTNQDLKWLVSVSNLKTRV